MENNSENFIQTNSPDGGFLQSEEWRGFQSAVGRKTHHLEGDGFWANIVEHILPLVGKYFYVPRGPIMPISNFEFRISNQFPNQNDQILKQTQDLTDLARKEKAGWIRIDPATEDILENIKNNTKYKIIKAPHDVQPKEIFIIDISKSEEEILAEMKSKTRYNIRLAEKKDVSVKEISNVQDKKENEKYTSEFLRLVRVTAKRDGIVSHPEGHYRKMLEVIPGDILKLYVAEYEGKVIAANLVLFYGDTCTYMHGASDNEQRNVMAPFLLQWRQIQDAKLAGCKKYDFGGVASEISNLKFQISNQTPISNDLISRQNSNSKLIQNSKFKIQNSRSWSGITRFKTGFSPNTVATRFPGSYDIIINKKKYYLYRLIQRIKIILK